MTTPEMKATKAETPNLAIRMIARFFGGKLDAFFGFAQKRQHGFRGATPSHAEIRAERMKVQLMKLVPFHKQADYKGKRPLSNRDVHRAEVK